MEKGFLSGCAALAERKKWSLLVLLHSHALLLRKLGNRRSK